MFLQINGVTADTKFASIVEPNYFAESVLIPGVTYTDKYHLGAAGQICVHKPKVKKVTAKSIGSDFDHTNVEDEIITINLDKQFDLSSKIYGVQEATVSFDRAATEMTLLSETIRAGRQAWSFYEIAKAKPFAAAVELTSANLDAEILKARKAIVDANSKPTALIVSTEVYMTLLLDRANFTPIYNDSLVANGYVGKLYGMPVFECSSLNEVVEDGKGKELADLSGINFIMLNAEAFSVIDLLSTARVKDAIDFTGVYAQVQTNSGFKVTNEDLVVVSYNKAVISA